jgi:lantibiotic leader peptide-processing serine protease
VFASAQGAKKYVIIGNGSELPTGFAESVSGAGGEIDFAAAAIGIATASSDDPGFAGKASKIPGVRAVVEDITLQFLNPDARVITQGSVETQAGFEQESHGLVGGHDRYRQFQWAPDAVSAPAAWQAGYRGRGARVAIMDGGIWNGHPDLSANVDVGASRSFVPGKDFNVDAGNSWHGTHVAGIVAARAAASNIANSGVVGIAPEATIIGVKVLENGSGNFGAIISGIYYAATPRPVGAGANIINMSLGADFSMSEPGAAQLVSALNRATAYARNQGVTLIAAAGNDAFDLDHTNNLVTVPAQASHVIAVAATGPMGWAVPGNSFNLDRPASYSNFGQSAINLAGPGGDFVLPGNALCAKPVLASGSQPAGVVAAPCWVFDMVFSTDLGGWSWQAGTSMSAPAVSAVAALVVGKYGPMHPAQLEAILRSSADDLGRTGNDDNYGRGRVNAARAVGIQ